MKETAPILRHRSEVLASLQPGRTSTRATLTRQTGLSVATVSRIVRDLLQKQILIEVDAAPSGVGRPVRGLAVNGAHGSVLGISLLAPTAQIAVLNLAGENVMQLCEPVHRNRGTAGILDPIKKVLRELKDQRPADMPPLLGVGVAVPGQWDPTNDVSITYPRLPEWKDVPIRALFEQWTGVPVSLIGHTTAMAASEQARWPGHEPRDLICVEVADQIGAGLVVGGTLVRGANGNAGELGHVIADDGGPLCYCGNRGCLESVASCVAIEDTIRASEISRSVFSDVETVTYEAIVLGAREGDPFSIRILGRAARLIGISLVTALNLLNPEVLLLSGRFFEAGDLVMNPLRAAIKEYGLPSAVSKLTIQKSELGPRASALGAGLDAARRALQRL